LDGKKECLRYSTIAGGIYPVPDNQVKVVGMFFKKSISSSVCWRRINQTPEYLHFPLMNAFL
ncbi:MAG: hypothetical protein P8X68_21975, partial [Desulfobacterales bacterium]